MRWGTWTSSPHRKPGGASRTQELGEEGTEAPLLVQPGPRPWCSRTLSVPQGHVPLAWCFSPHCWGSQVTPAPKLCSRMLSQTQQETGFAQLGVRSRGASGWEGLGVQRRTHNLPPGPALSWPGVGLPHLSYALWEGPTIGRAGAGDQQASSIGTQNCGGGACAPSSLHSGMWFGSLLFFGSGPVATFLGPFGGAPLLGPPFLVSLLRGYGAQGWCQGQVASKGLPSPWVSQCVAFTHWPSWASCGHRLTSVHLPVRGQKWGQYV